MPRWREVVDVRLHPLPVFYLCRKLTSVASLEFRNAFPILAVKSRFWPRVKKMTKFLY